MVVEKLFTPIKLGGKKDPLTVNHRIAMAPLTRMRNGDEGVPKPMAVEYYSQRTTEGGLLIAEATNITATARGSMGAPGIFTSEQINAWKPVTEAVHKKGGLIFLQLWHTGRISHPLNQPNGILPISSSSRINVPSDHRRIWTKEGKLPVGNPRALETEEIPQIAQDYRVAAENATAAGFDGVELHAANGYLLEQFLHDGINDRTDRYGGSVENRARFLFETLDAILQSLASSRVGIRLSPFGMSFGDRDSDPITTYNYVLDKLNSYDLAYVHIIEPRGYHVKNDKTPPHGATKLFRPIYHGVLMTASGYDRQSAVKVIEDGSADLVAIGRPFISNPDLVKRFELNAPLTPYDAETFYLGDERGYIDYPFLSTEAEESAAASAAS